MSILIFLVAIVPLFYIVGWGGGVKSEPKNPPNRPYGMGGWGA